MLKPVFQILVTAALLSAGLAAAQQRQSAENVVRSTIDRVVAVLVAPEPEPGYRRKTIANLITARFAFHDMAQRILATYWKETDELQRVRFANLFEQILANSYWDKISSFQGERVEIVKSDEGRRFATVSTIISRGDMDIPVDYKLFLDRNTDEWRAYDVVIEHASLIQHYRESFLEILERDGVNGLLVEMRKRVDENAKSS